MSEKKKYNHLVLDNPMNPPFNSRPMNSAFLTGNEYFWKQVDGATCNSAIYYVTRNGMFAEPPHYHRSEEYLMFMSSDPRDMKNLGAVIEVAFEDTWEKYTFSESCFIRFPANVVHCPINVVKLDRSFLFGHYWPTGEPAHFIPADQDPEFMQEGAPILD